jgi:hypothetical protein
MNEREKTRIRKALEDKDVFVKNGYTFFKVNGYIYVLPSSRYNARKSELTRYFERQYPNDLNQIEFWVSHNLTFGSPTLESLKDSSRVKIETVYQSNCAVCLKITDPDNYFDDEHDILFRKSLQDSRGNILTQSEIDAWEEHRQERNPWLESFLSWFKGWLHRECETNEPNEVID